ncbi:type II secretion system minor pseudopilin GspJ [Pseudocolwellia sp. AS88]|uniref:type II secretion system minor pseudopilin GspJ n=1 Tax=Pseudocolwellia TaxID=2848177 RepID=UPI0026F0CA0E|nr:type II secretion system minor pseudopilin GspJ [Pseudocolwellia sp. AS88]MDO7083601.1 type II secretion system minor pseudopilin GspJ [Pseudocolwellia sp. AS88]
MSKFAKAKGFTLLEVLVAISIFAIISLASFSLFDTVITSEEKSSKRIESMNDIQRAFIIIERDFLQIARRSLRLQGDSPLSDFIHTDGTSFESTSQSIGFVRGGWTNPGLLLPRSDMQSVAYQVNEETLERIHYNFVDASLSEEPKIRKLLTGVNDISFEFYYSKKWNQTYEGNDLPSAISIELDTQEFGLIKRKFLLTGIESASALTN